MRRVNRRLPLALSVAAIALLSSACSTFSDSNNVARVGDATLTADDFEAQLTALGAPSDQPVSADGARAEITTWIQEQLASSDAPQLDSDEVATRYDAGFASSGTACARGIVVADEVAATAIFDDLVDGAEFAELFAAANLDTSLTESGGELGCVTPEIVAANPTNESVAAVTGLSVDEPLGVAPIVDETGAEVAWLVLEFQPFADLSPESLAAVTSTVNLVSLFSDADIFVDSRYGTFDTTTGQVVGLG